MDERAITIVPVKTSDLLKRAKLIGEIQNALMKESVHYGKIPGCQKPTLFKPGAEKLCLAFRLATEYIITDLSTDDEIRYRVKTKLTSQDTGVFIGDGEGECSSREEKYNWRRVICEKEFEETSSDMRKEKWVKGWNGKPPYKTKMVRTNPADIANTILKMACKRSLVHAALTNTGASDIFTQDLEDLEEATREHLLTEEANSHPKANVKPLKKLSLAGGDAGADNPIKPTKIAYEPPANKKASQQQIKALRGCAMKQGFPEKDICARFKIKDIDDIQAKDMDEAIKMVLKGDTPE